MKAHAKTAALLRSAVLLLAAGLLELSAKAPCLAHVGQAQPRPGIGAPLKVLRSNPRYFSDSSGRAVYLTGSHTWLNFQDRLDGGRPPVRFADYLGLLDRFQHNFIRLWVWEDTRHAPLPFQRSGDGWARDGNPKFDLKKFNPEFFARLRSRVMQAGERGIYVSVMLFQGWSVEARSNDRDPWPLHPFHRDNNVNGIDGDPDGDGEGKEVHTLRAAEITDIQKRYVKAVIEALNDLDNVLWEISNESHAGSAAWQYELIRYIREEESRRAKQHPIGMTLKYRGDTAALFNSPADWISPGSENEKTAERYRANPPPADGAKVILTDTDHLFTAQLPAGPEWVWKSFARGYQPIFMDSVEQAKWHPVRRAMGDTLRYARRLDLTDVTPCDALASSGYCLADRGPARRKYLVFVPRESSVLDSWLGWLPEAVASWAQSKDPRRSQVAVDLSGAAGPLRVEWFNPATGESSVEEPLAEGGAKRSFKAPFPGSAVLYLSRR